MQFFVILLTCKSVGRSVWSQSCQSCYSKPKNIYWMALYEV